MSTRWHWRTQGASGPCCICTARWAAQVLAAAQQEPTGCQQLCSLLVGSLQRQGLQRTVAHPAAHAQHGWLRRHLQLLGRDRQGSGMLSSLLATRLASERPHKQLQALVLKLPGACRVR